MRISDWSSDVCSSDLIDGSFYQPIGDRVVLAGRARVGTIWGADRDTIAPSRRFYAGGGGSVRGYGYQDIGPRDANDDPIGGRRSEEHTSELQSLMRISYAVFCLKKKKKQQNKTKIRYTNDKSTTLRDI